MNKEDNDWSIDTDYTIHNNQEMIRVDINGTTYHVDDNTACLAHAILLLVDAVNDKRLKI